MIKEIKTVIAPVIKTCHNKSLKWPVRFVPISTLKPRNVNKKNVLKRIFNIISEKNNGMKDCENSITAISSASINNQLTIAKRK